MWCVFVNCLVKQFAICLGVFVIQCNGVVECGWRYSIGVVFGTLVCV